MDPFVAEIRIFPFNFAPSGWAFCNGQLMALSQNTALFALLGTTYGGDGKSTFGLPNLQGSAALGWGQGPGLSERFLGEIGGAENYSLVVTEIPAHTHTVKATNADGSTSAPTNDSWAGPSADRDLFWYSAESPATHTGMNPLASGYAGGGMPHNNMMPYLTLNFCIALQGVFPPRT